MSIIKELLLVLSAKIKYYNPTDYQNFKDGMKLTVRGITYIFVSILNSEKETQNILLHEVGHAAFGHIHLDCRASGWDRRQEREADRYMIEQRVDEWLAQYDWEPEKIDYIAFLDYFELDRRHYRLAESVFEEIYYAAYEG